MTAQDLQPRLKKFATRSARLFKSLVKEAEAKINGKQYLRAALFSAVNYSAACKAQTRTSFVANLSIAFGPEYRKKQESLRLRNYPEYFLEPLNLQPFLPLIVKRLLPNPNRQSKILNRL